MCQLILDFFFKQLDGWIARKVPGQASKLGSFLDPLADKILVTTMYLSLTTASLIPAPLTALIISRDVLLVYAGLYIRYMSVKPPVRFFFIFLQEIQNFLCRLETSVYWEAEGFGDKCQLYTGTPEQARLGRPRSALNFPN